MIPSTIPRAAPRHLVATFCHSPTYLSVAHRALFARALPRHAFEALLATTPVAIRQNVARIFAAALVTDRLGATLVFVEGWRCHIIERRRGDQPRPVTGATLSHWLLRLLQRRGLVAATIRPIRRELSRCTLDEVHAIAGFATSVVDAGAVPADDLAIVGIAGFACPSATRADRYLRAATPHPAAALSVPGALARWGFALAPAQRGLLDATRLRPSERVRFAIFEGANWALHVCSEAERWIRRPTVPLERRLAHRLRADQGE